MCIRDRILVLVLVLILLLILLLVEQPFGVGVIVFGLLVGGVEAKRCLLYTSRCV